MLFLHLQTGEQSHENESTDWFQWAPWLIYFFPQLIWNMPQNNENEIWNTLENNGLISFGYYTSQSWRANIWIEWRKT